MARSKVLGRVVLLVAAALGATAPVLADDVGLSSARLLETGVGSYALVVETSGNLIAAHPTPVVPERFVLGDKPVYERSAVGLVIRYEFSTHGTGLGGDDELFLPWPRSGVLLTTRWLDGSSERLLFPARGAGIPVPISVLRPRVPTPLEAARSTVATGFESSSAIVARSAVAGTLAALAATVGIGPVLLRYAGGLAVTMVAGDLGVHGLPAVAAFGLLAGALLLLARSVLRREAGRIGPLLLVTGAIDGLGLLEATAVTEVAHVEPVAAHFGALVGVALLSMVAVVLGRGMARIWSSVDGPLAIGSGALAAAMLIGSVASGAPPPFAPPEVVAKRTPPPIDLAASSPTRGQAGRALAPRRLEQEAMVFVTLEPREVRVEALLGLAGFAAPLGVDGSAGGVLPIEAQGEVASRALALVRSGVALVIDGAVVEPVAERSEFVTVSAGGVTTRSSPEPEPFDTAVLGVTLAFEATTAPREVELEWGLYPSSTTIVPATWSDPAASARTELTPSVPTLSWTGDLSTFELQPIQVVDVAPLRWPLPSLGLFVAAVVLVRRAGAREARRRIGWAVALVSVVAYPFARTALAAPGLGGLDLRSERAPLVVEELLENVYRAFELRREASIYDRLALVVEEGDQLREIYLEQRRALELENRGGARARVAEVDVIELGVPKKRNDGGWELSAIWTVSGSVSHFGHEHYRRNRYEANLELVVADGAWKLRSIEVADERREL